jgi:hypothetical protein
MPDERACQIAHGWVTETLEIAGRAPGEQLARQPRVTRRLGIGMVIALALLVSTAAASITPRGTSVLIFIDFSGSVHSASRASHRGELQRNVLPSLAPGDRIVIAAIHDKTLTAFRPLAEATLPITPAFNGWVDNRIKYERRVKATENEIAETRRQLDADVNEIFSRPYASPYTDIFSSLYMAQKLFDGDPRQKVVVLMSDMIEDYPPYKFDAMQWKPGTAEKIVADLDAKRQIPDLSGVCIYVSGASARNPQLAREIARFWEQYFRRARAEFHSSRYSHVLLHWPPSKSCAGGTS